VSTLKPIGNSLIGKVLAKIYSTIVTFRNRQFDKNPPKPLPFPVISVGGISAGGTGKTPLTALIIEHCIAQGKTPILFSRGYGRTSNGTVIIPADGSMPTWETVGDEPAMLRRRYPSLWLAIDSNRMRAAGQILQKSPKSVVGIMDDGFQHRYMHRDLNIVTLPANFGSDKVIPVGLLREPHESLQRADCIIFTGEPDQITNDLIINNSQNKLCGVMTIETNGLIHSASNRVTRFINEPVTLISGIARPERFYDSARSHFKCIKNHLVFSDHHIFSAEDLKLLTTNEDQQFCTTEKDWIRMSTIISAKVENLWYLSIRQRFSDPLCNDRFFDLINRCLEHK